MTNQSDIKKLAEQMAGSMKSFDDIKDFQKRDCKIFCVNPILTQGFIQEYLHERFNRSFA